LIEAREVRRKSIMGTSKRKFKAQEFDEAFESGKDITSYLDVKSAKVRRPVQRVNIDIPQEILEKVDEEAARVGVPRTSLIKLWIAKQVDRMAS
jgi:predicted DNA binding CopG/RHH family protein